MQKHKEKEPGHFRKRAMRLLESSKWSVKRMLMPKKRREELEEAFISAAWHGDNEKISRLIKKGVNIDAKDENGETTLHWAAFNGHTETCALIIEEYEKRYRNVNEFITIRNSNGNTALHGAIRNRRTETIQFLAEAGAAALVGKERGKLFVSLFRECISQ